MSIFKKLKQLWDEYDTEGVLEYKKYLLKVTFTDGEALEFESSRYHSIVCSYSEYVAIDLDRGLRLGGKLYPQHMIKHLEDEVIDTQLVCVNSVTMGLFGLDIEEIEKNQIKYKRIINKYKEINDYEK